MNTQQKTYAEYQQDLLTIGSNHNASIQKAARTIHLIVGFVSPFLSSSSSVCTQNCAPDDNDNDDVDDVQTYSIT